MPTTPSVIHSNRFDLSQCDIQANLSVDDLIKACIEEGDPIARNGAVVAYTGKYTGRTPKDKHIVRTSTNESTIWWDNNNPISETEFEQLHDKAQNLLANKTIYVIDSFAGADPHYRIAVRFILERPYHALFIKQLLIRPTPEQLTEFKPDWTVIDLCKTSTVPGVDPVPGDAAICLDFDAQEALLFGTEYAGEIKKSIFTVMNYLLPRAGVMSMHCSSNIGSSGDVALFFGLSGTGKTTLSADPQRLLIGDDEHGWSDIGVFNIEGGCYAKCIRLSKEGEPEIWDAIKRGAVLENVTLNDDGTPDYNDGHLTENTRCAYPIDYIEKRAIPSIGGHPKNIVFLTCDALGVLPPISRLTPDQAMDMFLIGYTAKIAGTEQGVTEPIPSFSTCFGQPFLPLPPSVYATLLREKIHQHDVKVWLVNTGWTGGSVGVGSRIKLQFTRRMLTAALEGDLDSVDYRTDDVFGFSVPCKCPDVPRELLNPRSTWKDKSAYDATAQKLFQLFADHRDF